MSKSALSLVFIICIAAGGLLFFNADSFFNTKALVSSSASQEKKLVAEQSPSVASVQAPSAVASLAASEQGRQARWKSDLNLLSSSRKVPEYKGKDVFNLQKVKGPHKNGKGFFLEGTGEKVAVNNADDGKKLILAVAGEYLNLGANDGLGLAKSSFDKLGNVYYKYSQEYKGLPVFGKESVLSTDKDNSVLNFAGNFHEGLELDTSPALEPSKAIEVFLADTVGTMGSSKTHKEPKIGVRVDQSGVPKLVYKTVVEYQSEQTGYHYDIVYVDANDGTVTETQTLMFNALSRKIYNVDKCLAQQNDLPGSQCSESNGAVSCSNIYYGGQFTCTDPSRNEQATAAFNNTGHAYNFYKNLFGRDSYDNQGSALKSSVCAKMQAQQQGQACSTDNAFWMGDSLSQMVYLVGSSNFTNPPGSLDITGHEVSHGVTWNSSQLEYKGESGAINEAFSDIVGAG